MNQTETTIAEAAAARGFRVLSSGWPDMAIYDGEGVLFVEVKGKGDELRPSQKTMHDIFAALGIPVDVVRTVDELRTDARSWFGQIDDTEDSWYEL